jgi:uncharacterized membrane protein
MFKKFLFVIFLIGAVAGLYSAFTLSVEKINLLSNPTSLLPCDVDARISCSSVMKTPWASLFGFPNSFLGLIGYSMAVIVAVQLLFGGTAKKEFFWITNFLAFLGFIFSYYLLYISVYEIVVLCPWCLLSATSATLINFSQLSYSLEENHFNFPDKTHQKLIELRKIGVFGGLACLWFIGAVLLVLAQFLKFYV